jgi:hypothetical protein
MPVSSKELRVRRRASEEEKGGAYRVKSELLPVGNTSTKNLIPFSK